jgi:hypothetical protein
LKRCAERNIHATKYIDDLPSTVFMGDEYFDIKDPPPIHQFDPKKTVIKKDFDITTRA